MTPEQYELDVRTSTRDVLRLADDLLTEQLGEIGFARRSRGIYERQAASAEVQGWLGLNESVADGVRLLPFVGVRHRAVEEMLDALGGSAYSGPLGTLQLGYLMPEKAARWWSFQGNAATDAAAVKDLVASVQRYALPFFDANGELMALAESVKSNADKDSKAFVLPVIYRLMDEPRQAEEALDATLKSDDSEAGALYRNFVERFMQM